MSSAHECKCTSVSMRTLIKCSHGECLLFMSHSYLLIKLAVMYVQAAEVEVVRYACNL